MEIEERIVQLLDGNLTEEDRKELESLIEKSPELKSDKALYEQIIAALNVRGEKLLRSELDGYLSDHLSGSRPAGKVIRMRQWFYIGGIAASLGLLAIFFYQGNQQVDPLQPIQFNNYEAPVRADSGSYQLVSPGARVDSPDAVVDSVKLDLMNEDVDEQ